MDSRRTGLKIARSSLGPGLVFVLHLMVALHPASALDNPHVSSNFVGCDNCHANPAALDFDNQGDQTNGVCGQCHNPSLTATYVKTHASPTYGAAVQCTECHNPHAQNQSRAYKAASYVHTGTLSTALNAVQFTTLRLNAPLPAPPAGTASWVGFLIMPDKRYAAYIYRIAAYDSGTNTITIDTGKNGTELVNTSMIKPGAGYAIVYGKLVKEYVRGRAVRFFRPEGTNSFADGDVVIDGVCQVCHSKTLSFTAAGTLEGPTHPPANGTDCTTCHNHTDFFKASCHVCHGTPPVVSSLGGPDGLASNEGGTGAVSPGAHQKHAVTIGYRCNTCHAGGMPAGPIYDKKIQIGFNLFGGAATNGAYDGRALPLANGYGYASGNAGTTITNAGTMKCSTLYCHSNIQPDGGTGDPDVYATPSWNNLPPDNVVCGSCHKGDGTQGNASRMDSGSHTTHLDSGPGVTCETCHGGGTHGDHSVDVTAGNYDAGGLPGNGYGSCASVSCHADGTYIYTGTAAAGASPQWGSSGECASCHGNTVYADYRKAAPRYVSGSLKPNGHVYHTDARTTPSDEPQCLHCHNTTTITNTSITGVVHRNGQYDVASGGSYRDGDNVGGAPVPVTTTYAFKGAAGGSACSNVSCHPTGIGGTKAASATTWNSAYRCTDCHGISLDGTAGYHHVMNANALAERAYPTAVPTSSATDTNRKCTMCHVDHNVFSPMLNANSTGRSMGLRTAIGTAPDPANASTYTNSDYAAGGGICISCHANELAKNISAQKNDGTTMTMAVPGAAYSSSVHQYAVSSTMTNGGSAFNANCSKCHTTSEAPKFQNSANTFRTHDNPVRRLLASLGMTSPSDPEEEDFCFRCHSRSDDNGPGGGPAKLAAGRDYYNVVPMSVASEAIYSLGRYSLTTTLYFRETVPTPPAPGGSGSSDTFMGGTWQARDMLPLAGGAPPSQTVAITDAGAPDYWRMTSFVSPPVVAPTTVPAGTWTLTVWGYESNINANCYLRATIYVWKASNVQGQIIVPPASLNDEYIWIPPGCDDYGCWDGYWWVISHELSTYNSANTLSLSGSQVALNAGDRILVEVEVDSRAPSATTYTATYGWGSLVSPASVPFNWLPASESAHRVANYSGIHKPSPSDETRAYLSANKHVECNDCHNPHAASGGTHSQGTNTVSNAANGVDGVQTPSWPSAWTTPTFDDARVTATYEWQICFKCHSGYNTNLSGWSATWTDLAKEFNPNNPGYHAVIGASRLPVGQGAFVNGWSHTSTMTCSDCHTNNRTGPGDPKGPHSSDYGGILKGDGRSGQLCFNCHDSGFSGSGFSGPDGELHNCHYNFCGGGPGSPMNCYTCHSKIPHGAPRPRLFVLNGDDPRYLDPSTGHENSWTQNTYNYSGGECSGYCH